MKDQKDELQKKKVQNFSVFFKALANEERLQILLLLHQHGEMFAQDVEKHFFLEQSTTSHHLNVLKRAGITIARKEGRKIFYSVDKQVLRANLGLFSDLFSND